MVLRKATFLKKMLLCFKIYMCVCCIYIYFYERTISLGSIFKFFEIHKTPKWFDSLTDFEAASASYTQWL
jgi:hypothetical protein